MGSSTALLTAAFVMMATMPAFAPDAPPATEQAKAVENLVNKAAALVDKDSKAAFAEFRKKDSSPSAAAR